MFMIRDLAESPGPVQELFADVLVIGAGIAGLLTAIRLARAGKNVVVAESGGWVQHGEEHPLNEVEQLSDVYAGARAGRFRCLGGTSTRWGGAMLPFQAADFTVIRSDWSAEWPISLDDLLPYLSEVEQLFKLGNGPYDFPEIMTGAFLARRAKWPEFRLRNLGTALREEIRSQTGPQVWLNATATQFAFDPSGALASVTMRCEGGGVLSVKAREFVIAAGAIESTRLLLLADRQHGDRIFSPDGVLGGYFYDHLSAPLATLVETRPKELNRLIGFSFEGRMMRNLRFEPSAELRADRDIAAGFVHIMGATDEPGGFDALREVYRKLQRRQSPSLADIIALGRASPWLARAIWWRFVEKRLLFPDDAEFQVHVVTEQEPRATNRIGLSSRRVDTFGCALATIDWKVHDDDAANSLATTEAFAEAWNSGALRRLGRIQPNSGDEVRRKLAEGGGIYHPGGTVRMGSDVKRGVVDSDLRTFRVPNISVVSTATFPTGGGANPTMMLMMAALRNADRIARQLR